MLFKVGSAAPVSLLEMHILGPHPAFRIRISMGGAQESVLTNPPGHADVPEV